MGYEWPEIIREALARYGLSYEEVEHAIKNSPSRWPRPAVGAFGIRVLTVWLRMSDGSPLIVRIQHLSEPFEWIVLGARPMSADEAAEFTRWESNR